MSWIQLKKVKLNVKLSTNSQEFKKLLSVSAHLNIIIDIMMKIDLYTNY